MDKTQIFSLLFLFSLFLLFVFLSTDFVFASDACEIAFRFEELDWKIMFSIAIIISFTITALMLMIGKAIGKEELIATAKNDLYQTLMNAVIVILFSSIVLLICNIGLQQFSFTRTSGNIFDASEKYFEYSKFVSEDTYRKTTDGIMYITGISTLRIGTTYPEGSDPWIGFSILPFAGVTVLLGALQTIMSLVTFSISIAEGYSLILKAIENYVLILLPAGVLLRSFSPTRGLGGVLIAISCSLFVFFPGVFAILYLVGGEETPSDQYSMIWWGEMVGVAGSAAATSAAGGGVIAAASVASGTGLSIALIIVKSALLGVGKMLLFVYLFPAIAWFMIASITNSLSITLGAELNVSTLGRLL